MSDPKHDAAQRMAEAVIAAGGTLAQAVLAAAASGAMTPPARTVADVLKDMAVAFWHEGSQELLCRRCQLSTLMKFGQAVSENDMNTLAKELGMTTCTRCETEIR